MIPQGFIDVSTLMGCGVYILAWKGEVVYVGQSRKLFQRITTHCTARGKKKHKLNGRGVIGLVFNQIWVRQCPLAEVDALEKELIQRYQPKYNEKHVTVPAMSLEMLVDMMATPMPPPQVERPTQWRRR